MKTIKLLALALFIGFTSCSDDDDQIILLDVETNTISNLFAPQQGGIDPNTGQPLPVSGAFTKFDFSTGTETTSETDWDIAFRGSTIIVNGGESFGNAPLMGCKLPSRDNSPIIKKSSKSSATI